LRRARLGRPPVIRRAIDRLQRDALALRLAADRRDGALELDAHDARGSIALRELPQHPDVRRRPRLTRTTLVRGICLARSLLADRRAGTFPCCTCHVDPP